jgi:hypothetical protein
MTDEDRRRIREALRHIRELRQELEITRKMLEACEANRERLERRVGELLADLTAIARMDGKE